MFKNNFFVALRSVENSIGFHVINPTISLATKDGNDHNKRDFINPQNMKTNKRISASGSLRNWELTHSIDTEQDSSITISAPWSVWNISSLLLIHDFVSEIANKAIKLRKFNYTKQITESLFLCVLFQPFMMHLHSSIFIIVKEVLDTRAKSGVNKGARGAFMKSVLMNFLNGHSKSKKFLLKYKFEYKYYLLLKLLEKKYALNHIIQLFHNKSVNYSYNFIRICRKRIYWLNNFLCRWLLTVQIIQMETIHIPPWSTSNQSEPTHPR